MNFNVTKEAVHQIKLALDRRKTPNAMLRIGVRGAGCSGFMYHLEFYDDEPKESDNIFAFQNVDDENITEVAVVIDEKSIVYLTGSELVWEKELTRWGFKINNPRATNECGCQESFSID